MLGGAREVCAGRGVEVECQAPLEGPSTHGLPRGVEAGAGLSTRHLFTYCALVRGQDTGRHSSSFQRGVPLRRPLLAPVHREREGEVDACYALLCVGGAGDVHRQQVPHPYKNRITNLCSSGPVPPLLPASIQSLSREGGRSSCSRLPPQGFHSYKNGIHYFFDSVLPSG